MRRLLPLVGGLALGGGLLALDLRAAQEVTPLGGLRALGVGALATLVLALPPNRANAAQAAGRMAAAIGILGGLALLGAFLLERALPESLEARSPRLLLGTVLLLGAAALVVLRAWSRRNEEAHPS